MGDAVRPTIRDLAWDITKKRLDALLEPPKPAGPRKPMQVHGSWCPSSCPHLVEAAKELSDKIKTTFAALDAADPDGTLKRDLQDRILNEPS